MPAPGEDDEIARRLADVAAGVDGMPPDQYKTKLRGLVMSAHADLIAVHDFVWGLADSFTDQRAALNGLVAQVTQQAAANVPQTGYSGGPQDYESAVAAAKSKAAANIDTNVRTTVVDSPGAKTRASTLAQASIDSMTALSLGIDSAYANATGPSAMRDGVTITLEYLQKCGSIEHEVRGWPRPAKQVFEQFSGFIERGEPDDKISLFIEGSRPVMLDVRDTVPGKLASRYQGSAQTAESERDIAWRVLRAFDEWSRSKLPGSITVANVAYSALKDVFTMLMGASPRYLSRAEFDLAHLRVDASKNDAAKPLKLAANWPARFIPGSGFALPGYSPAVMRLSSSGAPVRVKGR